MAITKKNSGNKINFAKEIDDTLNNEDDCKKRKKGGRPSNGEVKKLSVAISSDLLQENLEKYKEFQKIVQK